MVDDDGGSPGLFRFLYRDWNHPIPESSPYWPFDHTGQEFWWKCQPLSFKGPCWCAASVTNVDGMFTTGYWKFLLPTPTKPKEGAPWFIFLQTGWFDDTHYHWTAHTDIPCHMRILVGFSKPYISPTTHVTHGIVFHHDPILHFKWRWIYEQNEPGDDITHTFDVPYYFEDRTYWFVAIATVDGKESPSYSPPYSFRRYSLPKMKCFPPVDITSSQALLVGALWDDKGAPCYMRFQWGKVPNYTDETPVIGPKSSKHWWNHLLTGLDAATDYKVRTKGSHDKSLTKYGYSYPQYFSTMGTPAWLTAFPTGWIDRYCYDHFGAPLGDDCFRDIPPDYDASYVRICRASSGWAPPGCEYQPHSDFIISDVIIHAVTRVDDEYTGRYHRLMSLQLSLLNVAGPGLIWDPVKLDQLFTYQHHTAHFPTNPNTGLPWTYVQLSNCWTARIALSYRLPNSNHHHIRITELYIEIVPA